jgi:hypothetical protein
MRDVEFVLALVAVSAALRVVSLRLAIPYAPALVVAGLGIALMPGLLSRVARCGRPSGPDRHRCSEVQSHFRCEIFAVSS